MRPGDHVGEYVLIERMGEGGFGEVWRAENADLPGRAVAIKIAKDPSYVAALRREAQLLHRLDHPNVVRLLTIHASAEPPYLVLEHVRGESLRQLLDRRKRLEVEPAVALLLDVLLGLQAAHGAGLVHRDVKPSNVLIGPDGRPKLADFGLGRAVRSSADSVQVSVQGTMPAVVGTLDYMSPEQRRGEEGDVRSDLYACGVLLYEMIAGAARPVRLPMPGAPGALSKVVERVLAVDPSARFESATAMAAALRSSVLLPEAPGAPRSATPEEPVRPRAPVSSTSFFLLATATLLGLLYVFTAPRSGPRPTKPTGPADTKEAREPWMGPAADLVRSPSLLVLPKPLRHRGSVDALSFSPDGRMLATASSDGTVRLWTASQGDLVRTLDLGAPAALVVFSHDGKRVAAGGAHGNARVWTIGSTEEGEPIAGDIVDVLAMAFTEDDRSIVMVDRGGQIHVWDAGSGKVTSTAPSQTGLEACSMSADARCLAGLLSGGVEIRALPSGTLAWGIPLDVRRRVIAQSPDGRWLAIGHQGHLQSDLGVHLWSMEERELVRKIATASAPTAVAISLDGSLLAVAQGWKDVRLWSVPGGLAQGSAHVDKVLTSCLAFSPDSSMVALAGVQGARVAVVHRGPEPDWTGPPETAGGIPRLAVEADAPDQVPAGKTFAIVVQVRNSGTGVACQLWARIETDAPGIAAACVFGAVGKDQALSRSLVVKVPAGHPVGPVTGRVRFFDPEGYAPGPIDVRFEVTSGR